MLEILIKIQKQKQDILERVLVFREFNLKQQYVGYIQEQKQIWKQLEESLGVQELLNNVKNLSQEIAARNVSVDYALEKFFENFKYFIKEGGSYLDCSKKIKKLTTESDDLCYSMAVDLFSQSSAIYNSITGFDLGYEWFVYQGSNLTNTRDFCLAMTERKYFHITEIPTFLKGVIDSKVLSLNSDTGLPNGMIKGTNLSNFLYYRGGFECGHKIRVATESLVKKTSPEVFQTVISSELYKKWVGID